MTSPRNPLTYHPILKWWCTKCRKSGELLEDLNSVIKRWDDILKAHHAASPLCEGHGGITIQQERPNLPSEKGR